MAVEVVKVAVKCQRLFLCRKAVDVSMMATRTREVCCTLVLPLPLLPRFVPILLPGKLAVGIIVQGLPEEAGTDELMMRACC